MSAPLLRLDGLTHHFGGVHALSGVSFAVQEGAIQGLIGPNGAGKTTLFNCVTGVYIPSGGEVWLEDRRITRFPPHRLAALGLSRTAQNLRPWRQMTVLENVLVGCHLLGHAGFLAGALRLPGSRREERRLRELARRRLEQVGLLEYADHLVGELPLGRQRMVELTRALAADPRLLMLDEPAAGLHTRETQDLGRLIASLREQGTTVLLIEHDMSLVMSVCDQVAVLDHGELIAEGAPRAIQADSRVVAAYLGGAEA
jgi:branched-chain amino acid transport system ATP-binding protein